MLRLVAKYWAVMLLLIVPQTVWAAAAVNVYKVETNGDEVSDYDEIYVREDSTISFSFNYDADSDTDVDGWELWIGSADSGTLFDSGSFSSGSATVTFTTDDIGQVAGGSIPWRTDAAYNYDIVVKINYTEEDNTTVTDGDTDTYVDGDDDTSTVNDKPTQTITIHVDEDPPVAPVLDSDPIPGESSLLVSWGEVTESEGGNTESSPVAVKFCVRESDAEAALSHIFNVVFAADGDVDDEVLDGDAEESLDGDADDEVADGDADEPADGDTPDGDTPDGDTPDGDTPDGDTPDGDEPIEDGDTDDLLGCLEPIPVSDSGATSHRIEGLENGVVYEIVAKSVDLAGNESSDWSNPIYGTPQQVDDFWETYKQSGGKEDGGFCFIATAAYGSYSADQVQLLRRFRDDVLAKFGLGRQAIALYYRTSPPLAEWVAGSPVAAFGVRVALFPVIATLSAAYGLPLWANLLILLGFVMLSGWVFIWLRRLMRKEVA